MDIFEYALVRLVISEEVFPEKDEDGSIKKNIIGDEVVYRTVSVALTVFDYSTDNSVTRKEEVFNLGDKIYTTRGITDFSRGKLVTARAHPDADFLILAIGPILAKLGKEGWELIEYKFHTDPIFAHTLLKRRISPL